MFIQKGYKLTGVAQIIRSSDADFLHKAEPLKALVGARFKINNIIEITVTEATPILAPSYRFYPETTEVAQIQNALNQYGVKKL